MITSGSGNNARLVHEDKTSGNEFATKKKKKENKESFQSTEKYHLS